MVRAFGSAFGLLVLLAGTGMATTVVVPPGQPGTPVQDAIDAAAPGDTIRLAVGHYDEKVVVTKALKIRGVRSTSASQVEDTTQLRGDCGTGPVITIAADGVVVRGILIQFDNQGGVDVTGRSHVKIQDVFVASNCATVTGPAINVEQSTLVKLSHIWAAGVGVRPVTGAGVRIADTPQNGRVKMTTSIAGGYDVGVLLENDGINSIRLSTSFINGSTRGIVFQGTSRAIVDHDHVQVNTQAGVELDSNSSGNVLIADEFDQNGTDIVDNGSANCGRNDTYTTGSLATCP